MRKQSFHTSREALIRRLNGLKTQNEEKEFAPIRVERLELAYLRGKIITNGDRNMAESIGTWVEAKNEDSVVK